MKKKLLSIVLIGVVFGIQAQDQTINGVTFKSNGNLGIGTTNPNFGLTINSEEDQTLLGGNQKSVIRIVNSYASVFGRKSELQFSLGQSSNKLLAVIASEYTSWKNNIGGDLVFGTTSATSASVIERLRINSDGNVGIGTNDPSELLTIDGNVKILGSDKKIEWNTSNWGEGFGHKIYNHDPGGKTLLSIATRHNKSSWTDVMTFTSDEKIGIGTINPDSKLTVAGNIHSREVKVTINAGADFVFANEYKLPSLEKVELFIKENKHLPEIAPAIEMEKNGIHLAEMNIKLLQKIEELTLYTIQQQKEIKELNLLNTKLLELQLRVEQLESRK